MERLYDSIRTYVWAILGAQAQTRSNILKTGTGFDAQKQFLADIEDAIASPVDISGSISRYQKTLQYASTTLDRVWDWTLCVAERHGTPCGQYPWVQQRDPDSRNGYRTQPWDKKKQSRSRPRAIRHSKERSPHQPGPFTRGGSLRRTRRESAQLTTTARQRRNDRARRPTKKKNRPLWPFG